MKHPISLVLLGDIAAGKGTQAARLAKKFHLVLLDMGAYTRKFWMGNSKVSRRLEKTKLGKLTPSDVIQSHLRKTLSKLPVGQAILIDGGKMPAEARLIYRLLIEKKRRILVIYLRIPGAEIFRRLRYRYYCARTGEPLVMKTQNDRCPKCGARLIKRADDDLQAIRNRIAYYKRIYSRTVKFWRTKKLLKFINGNQTLTKVSRDIEKVLHNYYGI